METFNPKNYILKHKKSGRIYTFDENTTYLGFDEERFDVIKREKQEAFI